MQEDYQKQNPFLTDNDIDIILDVPIELLKETIQSQIQQPNNVDYIEPIKDKFRELKILYADDVDMLGKVDTMIVDLFSFVIQKIDDEFNVGVDVHYDNVDEVVETACVLYKFFIKRYEKNITKFIMKLINKNKKSIIENNVEGKKKDVTTIAIRRKVKSKDDVLILSNLSTIVKTILTDSSETDNLYFIENCCKGSNYEGNYIKNMILEARLVGDFVEPYFNKIIEDGLVDKIRAEITTKYIERGN